jgi:hypothetical protein
MLETTPLKSDSLLSSISDTKSQNSIILYDELIKKLDFSYFGLISMTILVGSILGGLSASTVLSNDAPIWQLCLVSAASMASNTAAIAQAPTKWVINLFILSILINSLLILINI